ncbi:hypothetical protein Nepgr_005022 [Nepenthes gracilis]|uniref:Uncharacterized protein n=1 Tax=Nepenthes gracilis TaxID=150966 RepID=A0AAD3S2E9_NEPGR|nr:hypothetical protein Nepgr_005022 [Nepenthes gracilis]
MELPHGGLEQEKLVQGICLLLQRTPSRFGRSQSPKLSRTCNSSSQSTPKRAISTERGDLPPHLRRFTHLHRFKVHLSSRNCHRKDSKWRLLQMWHEAVKHPADPRKPTPERKRSPLKGKKSFDQSRELEAVDALRED